MIAAADMMPMSRVFACCRHADCRFAFIAAAAAITIRHAIIDTADELYERLLMPAADADITPSADAD